jgi:curved DNA-binding protein CbpA
MIYFRSSKGNNKKTNIKGEINMTTFFKGIKTFKDLKDAYRKLAQTLHPDKETGNAGKFIQMKKEYDQLFGKMKDGKFDTDFEFKAHTNANYDFKDIIDKLIFVDGADIEICGSWIWVWNIKWDEKEKHEQLKKIGLVFAKGKKAWVYKGTTSKYWKKGMSMEDIRSEFGSEKIGKAPNKPLLD